MTTTTLLPQPQTLPVMTWGFDNDGDQDGDTSYEWEMFCDDLTALIKKINPSGKWLVSVENFGWQKLNGYSEFEAHDGAKFLSRILPRTECSFKVFVIGKGFGRQIKIQNWHHDSNCGDEIYMAKRQAAQK